MGGLFRRDNERLLKEHNYGFVGLVRQDVPLSTHFGHPCRFTLFVEATFVLVLAAFLLQSRPLSFLSAALALCVLGFQLAVFAVLVVSVITGKLHKRPVRKAVIYWSWWPVSVLPLSLLAAVLAAVLGNWLWHSSLKHYYELAALQRYKSIDPAIIPGDQVQDAGIVDFASMEGGVGVDRARASCLVNGGRTYCVAPIVQGSRVHRALHDLPRFGSYDYFAVGVDCCDCPVQEFRCGAWEDPLAQGGLRSMDQPSRPLFRLAVDGWAATYRKAASHPLFFDWVRAPAVHWRGMRLYVIHTAVLCACAVIPAAFCVALCLQWLRGSLEARGLVSPLGAPAPPPGMQKAWELFLPQLLQQHLEEQRQQLPPGLPRWYRSLLLPTRGRAEAAAAATGRAGSPQPGRPAQGAAGRSPA